MALKVKMTTSANRDGIALPNGSVQEFTEDEAVSLVRNNLAKPEGWTLGEDGKPVLIDDEADKPEAGKKTKATKKAE